MRPRPFQATAPAFSPPMALIALSTTARGSWAFAVAPTHATATRAAPRRCFMGSPRIVGRGGGGAARPRPASGYGPRDRGGRGSRRLRGRAGVARDLGAIARSLRRQRLGRDGEPGVVGG